MSARASANRYARALLDIAIDQSATDSVAEDLDSFAALVDAHVELHRVLFNPAIPVPSKSGLIEALAQRAGITELVRNLLVMLAERNRLALLTEVGEAYRQHLREYEGVVQAELTTATPIDEAQMGSVRNRLAAATGRRVTITANTDTTLVGGVVARVDSTVYYGSLVTQLAKMKARLGA